MIRGRWPAVAPVVRTRELLKCGCSSRLATQLLVSHLFHVSKMMAPAAENCPGHGALYNPSPLRHISPSLTQGNPAPLIGQPTGGWSERLLAIPPVRTASLDDDGRTGSSSSGAAHARNRAHAKKRLLAMRAWLPPPPSMCHSFAQTPPSACVNRLHLRECRRTYRAQAEGGAENSIGRGGRVCRDI